MTGVDAWHADQDDLERFLDGRIGAVAAASLETHVIACEECRTRLNDLAFEPVVDERWAGVRAAIETPRPGVVERAMRALGFGSVGALHAPQAGRLRIDVIQLVNDGVELTDPVRRAGVEQGLA